MIHRGVVRLNVNDSHFQIIGTKARFYNGFLVIVFT